MKKNERIPSMYSINREISRQDVANSDDSDDTLTGRVARVVTVFGAIRPLLLFALPILPPASRSAVTVFVESLDALSVVAQASEAGEVADFKAGRDL